MYKHIYIYYYCLLLLLLLCFISFLLFYIYSYHHHSYYYCYYSYYYYYCYHCYFFLGFRQGTVSTWNRSLGAGFLGSAPAQNLVPAKAAILNALKMGYRGIDTSEMNRTTINYH